MSRIRMHVIKRQKPSSLVQPARQSTGAHDLAPDPQAAARTAYRHDQVGRSPLAPSGFLALQRTLGNRGVQQKIGSRFVLGLVQRQGPAAKANWSDADPRTYPAAKDPGQLSTPPGGWNAASPTIGTVERIPLEGLKEGLQAGSARSAAEKAGEDPSKRATQESENGKAIAIVPTALKPDQAVEILLHLHGHNVGYRQRSKAGDGMASGSVRDVAADRIEQQIGAGGRNMIGILPQGTTKSGFGAFNPDAYIAEVWALLVALKKLPPGATRGPVVLSGHSGAAAPITQLLSKGNLPTRLGELVLFDAIHRGQRPPVEAFLRTKMTADVEALKRIGDPSRNGGLDAAAVATKQKEHLAGGFRFRGIFTPKYHPQKMDADKKPMWQDPQTKKKPILDESKWQGYAVEYEPLRDFIKKWIDGHTQGLDSSIVNALRENYKVVPAGAGATHNTIMGANDNLQSALSVLPNPAPAPAPTPASTTSSPAKTGALENAPAGGLDSEVASAGEITVEPAAETIIQAKRQPMTAAQLAPGYFAEATREPGSPERANLVQRQGTPAAPALTDAQQWAQDWSTYTGQQHYFAGSGRPAGTPRERYDILCPLYKAHGIPRPMVYMATSITTAKFYHFTTPAHTALAAALAAAESTLKGIGYATAPVKSVWALNPRTTSTGAWSNHADGKAVDIDPDDNPHLVEQKQRKIITLVTGTDIEKGGQSYDVMKGASDRFKADYNPAGLQRRIIVLTAAEKTDETERDTARSQLAALKGERETLKTERQGLKQQLKAVPRGKKATADDVAKATALQAGMQRKDANLKQVETEIKQKQGDLKQKDAALKQSTADRKLLEKQLTTYEATEKAIADLESAVQSLPDEIKSLEQQIAQSKQDEQDAKTAKNAAGVKAQQTLRARLQRSLAQKKTLLKKQQAQLTTNKKQRDADPLRKLAGTGFLNLSKDVVDALTGAGLKWGGSWKGAKDFMHFEL